MTWSCAFWKKINEKTSAREGKVCIYNQVVKFCLWGKRLFKKNIKFQSHALMRWSKAREQNEKLQELACEKSDNGYLGVWLYSLSVYLRHGVLNSFEQVSQFFKLPHLKKYSSSKTKRRLRRALHIWNDFSFLKTRRRFRWTIQSILHFWLFNF